MPKEKVFAAQTLKDSLPYLPLEIGKAKQKIKVFLSRQFCASLNPYAIDYLSLSACISLMSAFKICVNVQVVKCVWLWGGVCGDS